MTIPTIKKEIFQFNPESGTYQFCTIWAPINESTCWDNDAPICPYCGDTMTEPWELNLSDGDCVTVECGECLEEYSVSCAIRVTYTTEPIEGWPDEST
jgi:hypothetical protein